LWPSCFLYLYVSLVTWRAEWKASLLCLSSYGWNALWGRHPGLLLISAFLFLSEDSCVTGQRRKGGCLPLAQLRMKYHPTPAFIHMTFACLFLPRSFGGRTCVDGIQRDVVVRVRTFVLGAAAWRTNALQRARWRKRREQLLPQRWCAASSVLSRLSGYVRAAKAWAAAAASCSLPFSMPHTSTLPHMLPSSYPREHVWAPWLGRMAALRRAAQSSVACAPLPTAGGRRAFAAACSLYPVLPAGIARPYWRWRQNLRVARRRALPWPSTHTPALAYKRRTGCASSCAAAAPPCRRTMRHQLFAVDWRKHTALSRWLYRVLLAGEKASISRTCWRGAGLPAWRANLAGSPFGVC